MHGYDLCSSLSVDRLSRYTHLPDEVLAAFSPPMFSAGQIIRLNVRPEIVESKSMAELHSFDFYFNLY